MINIQKEEKAVVKCAIALREAIEKQEADDERTWDELSGQEKDYFIDIAKRFMILGLHDILRFYRAQGLPMTTSKTGTSCVRSTGQKSQI